MKNKKIFIPKADSSAIVKQALMESCKKELTSNLRKTRTDEMFNIMAKHIPHNELVKLRTKVDKLSDEKFEQVYKEACEARESFVDVFGIK